MNTPCSVPLVDLALQHRRVAEEVRSGFDQLFESTSFVLGPEVEEFEAAFAAYCGVAHAVGVANGTDALELALRAEGIGRGDQVIIPANTFVATAEAVLRAGADLVLADCGDDFLLDPEQVSRRATSRTRAVIAVHLYGQTACIEQIRDAAGHEVLLVEDVAQSQGARRWGVRAGALGDVAATSFYPGKNLGAYGDAGAVMTSAPLTAGAVRALRNHGGQRKYEHERVGMNSRMDSLQAVVLMAKLRRLDAWNRERQEAAARYDELLAGHELVVTPVTAEGNEHVFHLYVVRVPERDRVVRDLNSNGVGAGIHYPTPIHRLPAFSSLVRCGGTYSLSERFSREILSLPLFPGITAEQQETVVELLSKALP